jgi:hypothetical protein
MPGGRVRLIPDRRGLSDLTMILNKEPDRGGGVGGFEAGERALRRPAKWWKGSPDDTYALDCTIDIDAIGGPSVERRLRVLRDMGQPGEQDEPPSIKLDGDVWAEDKAIDWVMDDLTFGARLWNPDGTLRRQQVTVSLSRFEDVAEIKAITVRASRTGGRKRRRRVAVAKGNDTLRGLALRELGDSTRWKDIIRWNKAKLRGVDPDARLRPGIHLTIR